MQSSPARLRPRALAPIEVAIANWRGFVAARQSSQRLDAVFASLPQRSKPLLLQPPTNGLSIEGLAVAVPGTQTITLSNITFAVKAGSVRGRNRAERGWQVDVGPRHHRRVAPSAPARCASTGLPTRAGRPRSLESTSVTCRKTCNCLTAPSRRTSPLRENPDSLKVITASQMACVHEMVLGLPKDETRIGSAGSVLSAGQRQRIALARALYGNPFLVCWMSPFHLDSDGEAALIKAIEGVKARGGIVIVIAHRPSVLGAAIPWRSSAVAS